MKIVPIQLQIPTLNIHGAVVGSHPVPFYLITPTGRTDDGRGLAYALSHEDAQEICEAFHVRDCAAKQFKALAASLLGSLRLCVARLEEYGDAQGGTALELAHAAINKAEGVKL